MALTSTQISDCRRFMGYPSQGQYAYTDTQDAAYAWIVPGVRTTLFTRLDTLRPEEETILSASYLVPLNAMEVLMIADGTNLDTNKAAVWECNQNVINDREQLYTSLRRRLCAFLGYSPGPGLSASSNSVRLVRC